MNRSSIRIGAALLAAVTLAALTGCSTSSPNTAGGSGQKDPKDCTIGMLPKTTSDPNFSAMAEGARKAAKQLGYKKLDFNGPTSLDSSGQIQFIEQWTRQQYCGIMVSANDPDALLPAIKSAQAAGVKVTTFDSGVNSKDVLNLADFSNTDVGEVLANEIVDLTSEDAKVYVLTSTLTAPNQNAWLAAAKKVFKEKYPNVELQAVQPGQGDVSQSFSTAKAWLQAHPETQGILALDPSAVTGSAQAITSLGLKDKVKLTGIALPKEQRDAITSGVAQSFFLYNSPDVGYAGVQLLNGVIEGKVKAGDSSLEAGDLGTLKFFTNESVLLGKPLKFTKENVGDYDF